MEKTRIKICGLTREEDVEYVNEVLPEFVGFVFWDKSKRNLAPEKAMKLRKLLDDRIKTVGVFVDMETDTIVDLVKAGIISVVQLHGKETEETIEKLRKSLPDETLIIKAFEVHDSDDVKKANESGADMVLIDSGKGSGNVFDWSVLSKVNRPYFLAGGLSAENVGRAVCELSPYAVDVSSKVETDGVKDKEKIFDFCRAVRQIGGNK